MGKNILTLLSFLLSNYSSERKLLGLIMCLMELHNVVESS